MEYIFFQCNVKACISIMFASVYTSYRQFFCLFGGNRQFFFSVLSLVSKVESFSYVLLSLNHRSLMRVMER